MITAEQMASAILHGEPERELGRDVRIAEIDGGWQIERDDMITVPTEYVFSLLDGQVLQVFDGQHSVYPSFEAYKHSGD